jgi:hypothetical protein
LLPGAVTDLLTQATISLKLKYRQKTSKPTHLQPIDNPVPVTVGATLSLCLTGILGSCFEIHWGESGVDEQKRAVSEKLIQRFIRTLLHQAGLLDATRHRLRHTRAIEMIRHEASFEDVAATLGNTVAVVAKFYSHE